MTLLADVETLRAILYGALTYCGTRPERCEWLFGFEKVKKTTRRFPNYMYNCLQVTEYDRSTTVTGRQDCASISSTHVSTASNPMGADSLTGLGFALRQWQGSTPCTG